MKKTGIAVVGIKLCRGLYIYSVYLESCGAGFVPHPVHYPLIDRIRQSSGSDNTTHSLLILPSFSCHHISQAWFRSFGSYSQWVMPGWWIASASTTSRLQTDRGRGLTVDGNQSVYIVERSPVSAFALCSVVCTRRHHCPQVVCVPKSGRVEGDEQ